MAAAMREKLTRPKLHAFLERLGAQARTPGACYLTGGACALLEGWRETTIDVDLKFDPVPAGVFEAIPRLMQELVVDEAKFLARVKDLLERRRHV